MAKKRKASGRNTQPTEPRDVDAAAARLGPITSYKDVADSEDEYFINRDQIMIDDEPNMKRRKRAGDDIELSDEDLDDLDDDSEEADGVDDVDVKQLAKSKRLTKGVQSDEEDGDGEEVGDDRWWGSSRKEYYNADMIETEADALEEEAEAKRLQQKKLSKMADEDFMFDGDEWLATEGSKEDEADQPVTEVLKEIEITDDMGTDERRRLLRMRYPEFGHIATELEQQTAALEALKQQAQAGGSKSLEAVQYWVLGCYVAALAGYFAILSSPARDSRRQQKALEASELRDHDVMATLVDCREAWRKIKDLKSVQSAEAEEEKVVAPYDIEEPLDQTEKKLRKKQKKAADKALSEKKAKKLAKAEAVEDKLADLDDLPLVAKKTKKKEKSFAAQDDSDSDFGEETSLDARTAADKAARKKSLKFYTSQVAQKANRRAGASRDAGGDMDIPYRERLKDRQARLLREAENRAKSGSKKGADLDDNSDSEEETQAKTMRNNEDEYYDMVKHTSDKNKQDKAARYAAFAAASKADRVVEREEVGQDGKRKITYAIEKNKGLAPKRKKEVRNPRVKKKIQFEAKQKKLASMKPTWKGGEPKGGYRGEVTGINTGVIKSTRL
ncbi:U3 small nucleolar RNA-associated protein 3 [Emericellopsis cladophorae]|uniref:U3 small nucleolar RNA-associated protein 3 n=1 Tax=Emericellopsis cladophorae TaxID=2686198 RepID=A0A9P9XWC1_9HYPO|nr:U3 small nucleolar RNA-associated protein 3 [Emericellopsis cladophorae]KAI6778823.1 U3 small nucleolar RNA-associated protein 3 [Emericellopsis cladophorae]